MFRRPPQRSSAVGTKGTHRKLSFSRPVRSTWEPALRVCSWSGKGRGTPSFLSSMSLPATTSRRVSPGKDIYDKEEGVPLPFALHEQTRNAGSHVLRTGQEHDSFVLLPFVPPAEAR